MREIVPADTMSSAYNGPEDNRSGRGNYFRSLASYWRGFTRTNISLRGSIRSARLRLLAGSSRSEGNSVEK